MARKYAGITGLIRRPEATSALLISLGKLFWEDSERVTILALLLENVGVDRAVRLGNAAVWRAAVEALGGDK